MQVGVPVKIPAAGGGGGFAVKGGGGAVASQPLAAWPSSPFVHGGSDQPPMTLHPPSPTLLFLADVPALGTATYLIEHTAAAVTAVAPAPAAGGVAALENGRLTAAFDPATGLLLSLTKPGGPTVKVKHTLKYYIAGDGTKSPYRSAGASGSGNYIFQPASEQTYYFTPTGAPATITHVAGPLVQELRHLYVKDAVELVYRLYNGSDVLEVEYRLGPLDIADGKGKEVLARLAINETVILLTLCLHDD